MLYTNAGTEQFTETVLKNDNKIILYGFGVIGKITAPMFLKEKKLFDRLCFFTDADQSKQGIRLLPDGEKVKVLPPDVLNNIDQSYVIVITSSRYTKIIEYLQKHNIIEKINVFILPEMLCKETNPYFLSYCQNKCCSLIPPIIHYCWFSKNPIPSNLQSCIESWKKLCPDYEIIEWNEDNYDVNANKYTSYAYKNKMWAYVSDYARFEILYKYGGFYFDTDVEFIKSINNLRFQKGFLCTEKWGIIASGAGCGFVPEHPVVKKLIKLRDNTYVNETEGSIKFESSGYFDTLPFLEQGFIPNDTLQQIDDITIYPSEYFIPYNYMTGKTTITSNTYSIHHYAESWVEN